ncbi:MAG: leucine-rich repeat protein [Ruminococcus sp.]|nr:leucine-rich repeat protein [Ruminococcus sp.]
MIQKIKKPISILLTVLMVFSVFAVVPFTASAASNYEVVDVTDIVKNASSVSELQAALDDMVSVSIDEGNAWEPPLKSGYERLILYFEDDSVRFSIFNNGAYVNNAGTSDYSFFKGASAKFYYLKQVAPTTYTITWKNEDGSLIGTTEVEEGVVPTHDDATKEADAQYTYTFAGWDPTPVAAAANTTYTATFTSTRKGINGSFGNLSWNLDDNGVLTFSGSGAIPNYGFDWSSRPIKKIIINDSVTAIGDCAFRGCTKLKEVVFESNPVLDWDSFPWCSALESVTLPQNMETIGRGMFRGCTSLKTIELPATIKKIGMSAFNQSGLESLTVPEGVEIEEGAFEECASLQSLVLESSTPVSYQAGYLTTLGDVTTVTVSEGSHYDRKARTDYNLTLKEGAEIPEWIPAEMLDHLVESANWTFNDCIEQGMSEEEALAEASDRMPPGVELEVHKTEIEAYDQIFRTGDTCPDVFGGATLKVALDDATIAAINAINAIGTVELTDACKEKVDAARAAYDALNDVQKTFVPAETLATLEAAEDAMKVVASVTSNGSTTKYTDIETALGAWADGSTLTLLADVSYTGYIFIDSAKTFDLNGHGFTFDEGVFRVESSGYLTLIDSDSSAGHKYTPATGGYGRATVDDINGTVSFAGGYITGGTGASVDDNSNRGGAVYVSGGTFDMRAGTIIGNSGGWGGGVFSWENGTVLMSGGAVIGNYSDGWWTSGGGMYIEHGSSFKMSGGTISGNKAANGDGGGLYLVGSDGGTFEISGGTISGNSANGSGDGVFANSLTLTLSGNPIISGNEADNLYINNSSVNVSSALTDGANIGVTMQNGTGVFTNSTNTDLNNPNKFFSDNSAYGVLKNTAGQLELKNVYTVTWKNWNDDVLETDEKVFKGTTPTYDGTEPTKPADDTNTYTFSGWKNGDTTYAPENLPEVTGDVTYTAQFTSKPKTLISGHSLTLDGDIGINFYIDPSVAGMSAGDAIDSLTYTLEWETPGVAKKPLTVVGKAIAPDNQKIIVTCKVCAAEMTCGIKASFSLGTKTENEVYSVRKYCDEGILGDDAEYKDDASLVYLAQTMLDYGAKAQKVFGVKTDDLANEGLKYTMPEDMPDFDAAVQRANGTKSNVANVTLSGGRFKFATLVFLSESTLRLYFENSGSLPTAGMTKWNDYYYMQKIGIPASKLDTLQKFTVGGTTLTYSALDYAKGLSTNANTDYVALAKAIYWYNQAANVYYHDADHTHTLEAVAEVPATTEEDGVAAHYECSECGKLFTDAEGNNETTAEALVIPKLVDNVIDINSPDFDGNAKNGDVLTGTLTSNKQITIAAGATVTLRGVDITCLSNDEETANFAGITLLGDATILLEGENTVKGGYEDHPGVFVPANTTLTINGTGSLDASSGGDEDRFGCGIGGGYLKAAGNIVINGGTITATGGGFAAGIGSGNSASCGNITITGGKITANGGEQSAGIGSGEYGRCGNITIAATVTQVTATKGSNAPNSIGAGYEGFCGTVTIEDGANVTQN